MDKRATSKVPAFGSAGCPQAWRCRLLWHARFIAAVAWLASISAPAGAELSLQERIAGRQFPSILQAWNDAEIPGVSTIDALVRHDLYWHGATAFGLEWEGPSEGEASSFVTTSIANGLDLRADLLGRNENMVLLAEIRYRDSWASWLPADHPWWRRDEFGNLMPGWQGGSEPYYLLDFDNPEFRAHVAAQSAAAVESGVVDGVMLDWYGSEDASRIDLVERIRTEIGPEKLIIVNVNANQPTGLAPYINGIYMETDPHDPPWIDSPLRTPSPSRWQQIVSTLQWAETSLASPKINGLETWYTDSRDEPQNLRMTTTAALTLSDGYALFGDPNFLATPDHAHDWYDFWDADLGQPVDPPQTDADQVDGGYVREFTNGEVVFNPLFNTQAMIRTYGVWMLQVSTGMIGKTFQISVGDGDIFLVATDLPPFPTGDYNHDREVDLADYDYWKSTFGSIENLDADGNENGIVDAADYTVWRFNFENRELSELSKSANAAPIPEPATLEFAVVAGAVALHAACFVRQCRT